MEQYIIDKIKEAAKIEEIIGDFIPLKRHGAGYICKCPFHPDKTPSLNISPSRNIYKCFACNESGDPIKFLMRFNGLSYIDSLNYIANKYGIDTKEYSRNHAFYLSIMKLHQCQETPKMPIFLSMERVEKSFENILVNSFESSLTGFLTKYFDKNTLAKAYSLYKIGVDYHRDTIFWQIDKGNNVRTAHIIPFDPVTGHRLHKGDIMLGNRNESAWMQSRDFWSLSQEQREQKKHPDDFEQCLFGEHLLSFCGFDKWGNEWQRKPVAIVESEKTALIMSMIKPQSIWLACSGLNSFGEQKKKALAGRRVFLYADADGASAWQKERDCLNAKTFMTYPVELVTMPLLPGCEKWDIADFELKKINPNYR